MLSYDPPGAQDFNWRASGVGGFWNSSLRVCVGGRAVFVVSHQLQGGGGRLKCCHGCGVSCVLLESRGHQLAGDENVLRGSACTVAGELIRMILLRNFVTVLQNKADGDKSGFHSLRRALAK